MKSSSMENRLRNHNHNSHPPNNSNSLAMHRDSHTISKITKPKIRIIHIFAPEIIKTDAENFRELVQKLTGKPSGEKKKHCNNKNKKTRVEEQLESRSSTTSSGSSSGISEDPSIPKKKELVLRNGNGFWGLDLTRDHNQRVKEEEKGGGYLGGFSDLEGFISEINTGGYFPLLPLDDTTHDDHMQQGFEEVPIQLL